MKVGIIGAGTMGSGIAQAFAQTEGYEVMLCDINETFAANGKNKIAKTFEKMVAKGKMTQEAADGILAKIKTGTKEICAECDLVVEAAIENMEIKKQTFKELYGHDFMVIIDARKSIIVHFHAVPSVRFRAVATARHKTA